MTSTPAPSTRDQHHLIARKLIDLGYTTRAVRLAELSRRARRDIPVFAALSHAEAAEVIAGLEADQHAARQDATLASLRADGWAL